MHLYEVTAKINKLTEQDMLIFSENTRKGVIYPKHEDLAKFCEFTILKMPCDVNKTFYAM